MSTQNAAQPDSYLPIATLLCVTRTTNQFDVPRGCIRY